MGAEPWGITRGNELRTISLLSSGCILLPSLHRIRTFIIFMIILTYQLIVMEKPKESNDKRVRTSKDQCGVVCASLLPICFLSSVSPPNHYYLLSTTITSLSISYSKQAYFLTVLIITLVYGTVTMLDVRQAETLFKFDRSFALTIPLTHYFLLNSAKQTFTHAEASIISGLMCSTLSTTIKRMIYGCNEVEALTIGALCGAIFIWWIGIGAIKNVRNKVGLIMIVLGGIFPSYLIAFVAARKEPASWLFSFCIESKENINVILTWLILLIIGIGNVRPERFGYDHVIARKYYHLLAGAIFSVGYQWAGDLTRIASASALALLIIGEVARIGGFGIEGEAIMKRYAGALVEDRDGEGVVVSHIYLLLGCATPGWISNEDEGNMGFVIGGTIAVCVVDTVAAIVGKNWGLRRWLGTNRTKEGTFAATMIATIVGNLYGTNVIISFVASTMAACVEAFTEQNDNLVIAIMYCCVVSVLSEVKQQL